MTEASVAIVIPSRNRGPEACRALQSALEMLPPNFTIVVSDNSTNPADSELLEAFCNRCDQSIVAYLRAPRSMTMSEHWQWAMCAALKNRPSHVTYLSDRRQFQSGALEEIAKLVEFRPSEVVVFNEDQVDDYQPPIQLRQQEWTGRLFKIESSHLLALASRAIFGVPFMPRMHNCVVPRPVLHQAQERFGAVFASVSPDYCFGFRCLELVDSILYYDKALLISSATYRSIGSNYLKGGNSPDLEDYRRQVGSDKIAAAAPIPMLETPSNAMVHEYYTVKLETQSAKFKDIDRYGYLGALAWDAWRMRNHELSTRTRTLLEQNGWSTWRSILWWLGKLAFALRSHPYEVLRRLVLPWVAGGLTQPIWFGLSRLGLQSPASRWFRFSSTDDALDFAKRFPRRRSGGLGHLRLKYLMDPPSTVVELAICAARPMIPASALPEIHAETR